MATRKGCESSIRCKREGLCKRVKSRRGIDACPAIKGANSPPNVRSPVDAVRVPMSVSAVVEPEGLRPKTSPQCR